jgi:hypothetical protein
VSPGTASWHAGWQCSYSDYDRYGKLIRQFNKQSVASRSRAALCGLRPWPSRIAGECLRREEVLRAARPQVALVAMGAAANRGRLLLRLTRGSRWRAFRRKPALPLDFGAGCLGRAGNAEISNMPYRVHQSTARHYGKPQHFAHNEQLRISDEPSTISAFRNPTVSCG